MSATRARSGWSEVREEGSGLWWVFLVTGIIAALFRGMGEIAIAFRLRKGLAIRSPQARRAFSERLHDILIS